MNKPIIPIVFAANNSYTPFCYTAVYSTIKHTSDKYKYKIYIFQTDINAENRNLLESLSCENADVECIDISKVTANVELKGSLHLSIETYYRLFIPLILPQYEKILYLDSDMCMLADVAELYNTDIGDHAVGAAPDVMCYGLERHSIELGNLDCRKTFNAGVLVMNTVQFEKQKIREKCLELLAEDYKRENRRLYFADQDALNIVLYENYYVLDQRWNYQPQYLWRMEELFDDVREKYVADKDTARIMHFAGEKKPWRFPDFPTFDIFWKYAKETCACEMVISLVLGEARVINESKNCFDTYKFPYESVPFGSRVLIYAAGMVGKAFYGQIKQSGYAKLAGWVDKNWDTIDPAYNVKPIETINETEYDYIIIAVESERTANSIRSMLIEMNVPENKIVWEEYRIK